MVFGKGRLIALALALSVSGVVACDSGKEADSESGTKAVSEAVESEAKSDEGEAAKPVVDNKALPFEATGPVAVIDGHEIPAERFNTIAQRRANQLPGTVPPQMLQVYKKQTLDMVVDEYLIERKIETDKVEVTDEEIDSALEEFKKNFPNDEVFQAFLEHNAITEEIIRTDIGKDVALRKLVSKDNSLDVTDQAAQEFYQQHKERFHQQEEVQASHILLKIEPGTSDEKKAELQKRAEELAKQAKASDADFAKLAQQHSECPSASAGGDLGFFPAHRMVPEFSQAAFSQKVGEVSDPVLSQFGYHIIKVVDRRDERSMSFDEVKDQIKTQLENMALREAMGEFLEGLKQGVTIELKEANIVDNVQAQQAEGGLSEIEQLQQQLQLQLQNSGLQDEE